jgi:hypothetical protein
MNDEPVDGIPDRFLFLTASREQGNDIVHTTAERSLDVIQSANLQINNLSGSQAFIGFDVLLGPRDLDLQSNPADSDLAWQVQFDVAPDEARNIDGAKLNFAAGSIIPPGRKLVFNNFSNLSTGTAGSVRGFFRATVARYYTGDRTPRQ